MVTVSRPIHKCLITQGNAFWLVNGAGRSCSAPSPGPVQAEHEEASQSFSLVLSLLGTWCWRDITSIPCLLRQAHLCPLPTLEMEAEGIRDEVFHWKMPFFIRLYYQCVASIQVGAY